MAEGLPASQPDLTRQQKMKKLMKFETKRGRQREQERLDSVIAVTESAMMGQASSKLGKSNRLRRNSLNSSSIAKSNPLGAAAANLGATRGGSKTKIVGDLLLRRNSKSKEPVDVGKRPSQIVI